jgi:predicted Zn-dependent peptidase
MIRLPKFALAATLAAGGLAMTEVRADVHLDHEEHPIPLVELTVILPVGFEAKDPTESGAANLLSDIFEAGTMKLDRQAYLDKLAAFGASQDFTVSNQYSFWKLSFPYLPGKDYGPLASVLAENWREPRFTDESFKIARTKMEASLTGSLDSDMSLGVTTARRLVNKRDFGGNPLFIENLARLKLDTVKKVFDRDFRSSPEIWVGLVGPKETRPVVEQILRAVFAGQGEIKTERYLKKLPVKDADSSKLKPTRTAIIIDKPERNQVVTSFFAVAPEALEGDKELSFQFGNHILVDSGLGSIFGEEIRNKRGLAYSVSPLAAYYLGRPVLGFAANPVRNRADEAFTVFANLLQSSYETAEIFTQVPDEAWDRQWRSFRYAKTLEQSTPSGRLGERMAVVTGGLSPELYKMPIEKWDVTRKEASSLFRKQWKNSVVVMTVVGDAKELKPLVAKHFPGFETRVVNYKDTIRAAGYP